MNIETCCPDSPSKKGLLPWVMIVVSANSLQLATSSKIASAATNLRPGPSGDRSHE